MMDCNVMIKAIDNLASDLVFLDNCDIDVPSSGKFMNVLEKIIKEAEQLNIVQVTQVATALNQLLEKIVFNMLPDKEGGFRILEQGTSLMQEIAEDYYQTDEYKGDINLFLESVASMIGEELTLAPAGENGKEVVGSRPQEKKTKIQDVSLVKDFITEGLEYIDEIEVNILNLEQDPTNTDYVNTIFRPFHSIKGVASFLNLDDIRDLAHNLENLLDKARNNEIMVTPPLIDIVLDGADVLKAMIIQIKDEIENQPVKPLNIDMSVLLGRIKKAEEGKDEEDGVKKLGEILVDDGVVTSMDIDEALKIAQNPPPKKIGQTLIGEKKATPKQVSHALRKQTGQMVDTSTLRVDTHKLDDLIDMVGELVITQSMIQQDLSEHTNADKNLTRDISQFFRITSSLQRTSMGLRMIPIKQTFQRMSRLVRDLAKNAGKNINVEFEGEETEIDRNMVEEIYNPLVHMVRNSVDHGLETPEERVKTGKPERGLINLRAYHRGGNIVIEIADDGRGLNKDKIIDKALKKGIMSDSEGLSDQDIYKMIFMPGLSTAEKVTDVSGRGVGMDVVKQAVEKLRGKIEIESAPGRGTKLITSVPLTLAIIDGILVKVGQETYILPTTAIRQTLRPAKEHYNQVVNKGEVINVMGQLLPLIRLYEIFGIQPQKEDPSDAIVVVLENGDRSKCLLVDEIIGKAEVVIKNLGAGMKHVKGVSGGAILGDGRVGLILDPEGLFELSEGK
ncbi:MAG: chemotaxis protein CheA [Deltaproteobacteria bacterium]|nr:chemotaxis protein CheA [Deltaproteobacteria bacterium]